LRSVAAFGGTIAKVIEGNTAIAIDPQWAAIQPSRTAAHPGKNQRTTTRCCPICVLERARAASKTTKRYTQNIALQVRGSDRNCDVLRTVTCQA
jgi:hypothetical protein